jgi:hypothetical protein
MQLFEEPEPLLGEREWPCVRRRRRSERRNEGEAVAAGRGHATGEPRDRRRFEERPQGQIDVEGRAHARDDLRGDQRMTAEREEVLAEFLESLSQCLSRLESGSFADFKLELDRLDVLIEEVEDAFEILVHKFSQVLEKILKPVGRIGN